MALAYTGQEKIYRDVYMGLGLSEEQIGEFFCGPAYLSWSRGQGMYGVGGPLPTWWYDQQAELNVKIVTAMRALGITTILPGFQGNGIAVSTPFAYSSVLVPLPFITMFPNANISKSGWLDALDPLFTNISGGSSTA